MFVYVKSESGLWTVGHYEPNGKWVAESDHDSEEKAAARVSYLNGAEKRRPEEKEGDAGSGRFDAWAIIDLFGHQRLAGRVTEQVIGGCSFVRVDVPECPGSQGFTRLLGNGAIYSITLVDEKTARAFVAYCRPQPMDTWEASQMLKQLPTVSDGGSGNDPLPDEDEAI